MIEFGDLYSAKEVDLPPKLSEFLNVAIQSHSSDKVTFSIEDLLTSILKTSPPLSSSNQNWFIFNRPSLSSILEKYRVQEPSSKTPPTQPTFNSTIDMYEFLTSPLTTHYSLNNYLDFLCIFDFPPSSFQESLYLVNDVIDAIIFNLRYQKFESEFQSSNPSREYNSIYDKDLEACDEMKDFCNVILPKNIISSGFCAYSMSAFFSNSEFNPFLVFPGLKELKDYEDCRKYTSRDRSDKHRTFRAMLNNLSTDDASIIPQNEDKWYLEKLFGFNTVSALFPFWADESRSRSESLDISNSVLKILMKCKPPRIRIYLASTIATVAKDLKSSYEQKSTSKTNLYDPKFLNSLMDPLSDAIDYINYVYLSLLNLSDKFITNHVVDPKDVLVKNEPSFSSFDFYIPYYPKEIKKSLTLFSTKNYHTLSALYEPLYIVNTFQYFPLPDPIKKEFSLRNDSVSAFASLQTTALISILEHYGIPLPRHTKKQV